MMILYSGITCPFSHRCRFVLYEKGMDFEIKDVDIFNKPEDLAVMNPYNQVPVLVERDLILHESNIINEYIDERFPHPQLMPGDPVQRGRGRFGALPPGTRIVQPCAGFGSTGIYIQRTSQSTRSHFPRPDHASTCIFQTQIHHGRRLFHD